MDNSLTQPKSISLDEAKRYISSIDFTKVIDRVMKENKWLKTEALEICELYRHFLYLFKKHGDKHALVPPGKIDIFWHAFILTDTKAYMEHAQNLFGAYLHHIGTANDRDDSNSQKERLVATKQFYQSEFGKPLTYKRYYLKPLLRWLKF